MTFLRRLDDRALPAIVGVLERASRHRAIVGVLAVVVGLGVIAAALASTHPFRPAPAPVTRSVTKVGPVEGTAIPAYVADSQRELAGLARAGGKPVYALVSLTGYGTPAQVAVLTEGYPVSKVYFRVPLMGVQTEIRSADVANLRRDVEGRMRIAAAQAERTAKESDSQAALLTGTSAPERQLRAFYAQSARLLRVQAGQYRSLCACVYSLVVKATPQALTLLGQRAGIRAVDPAPEISALDRAVFLPLLPEQRDVVRPPADSGLPPLPTPSAGTS